MRNLAGPADDSKTGSLIQEPARCGQSWAKKSLPAYELQSRRPSPKPGRVGPGLGEQAVLDELQNRRANPRTGRLGPGLCQQVPADGAKKLAANPEPSWVGPELGTKGQQIMRKSRVQTQEPADCGKSLAKNHLGDPGKPLVCSFRRISKG